MTAQAGQLVVVAHFEPPPAEEAAELLSRAYGRLLPGAILTEHQPVPTITPQSGPKGDDDASRTLRQG